MTWPAFGQQLTSGTPSPQWERESKQHVKGEWRGWLKTMLHKTCYAMTWCNIKWANPVQHHAAAWAAPMPPFGYFIGFFGVTIILVGIGNVIQWSRCHWRSIHLVLMTKMAVHKMLICHRSTTSNRSGSFQTPRVYLKQFCWRDCALILALILEKGSQEIIRTLFHKTVEMWTNWCPAIIWIFFDFFYQFGFSWSTNISVE